MTPTSETRSIARVTPSIRTVEGEGLVIRRAFPVRGLELVDPFLLLDHMGPVDIAPGSNAGVPDHPHRGFETVSYILEGALVHRDSRGNTGRLGSGDVQWMTAGSGIVHSEMPDPEFVRTGGRLHGFQIWVNLPRRDKMMTPRYQEVPGAGIPSATSEDGLAHVRVIAGESLGVNATIETRTPIMYLHFTLQPGARITQPTPKSYNALVYVFSGTALVGRNQRPVAEGEIAVLEDDGEDVWLGVESDASAPAELLLLAGEPLNEPVARYGPFVMNTEEEIYQAVEDFRSGKMGSIQSIAD